MWVATMFIFIYVDYFGLFVPGVMEKIIDGEVANTGIRITQVILLTFIALMIVPSLMIALSLTLKAEANRRINIVVGILQIIVPIAGLIGEPQVYYIFATIVEVVLLSLVVRYACKWPMRETLSQ